MCQRNSGRKHQSYEAEKVAFESKMREKFIAGKDQFHFSDKADLDDPNPTAAFRKYFDKISALYDRAEHCGKALIGLATQLVNVFAPPSIA